MSGVSAPSAPTVSVVITTRSRPTLLRRAVRSVLRQDYPASIELLIVFDQSNVDPLTDIVVPDQHALHILRNHRTPGLAGGRNTGIEAATQELVAFCDDDDEWMPDKLAKQAALFSTDPEASLVATGIRIQTEKSVHIRLPPARVTFQDLLRSRITEIHPSSFLMGRQNLLERIGLIDEALPGSYGEDYDLLLRAARTGPILSVVSPLVLIYWNRSSFFSERWDAIASGLTYLMHKHPELAGTGVGAARIEGQIAFAHAARADPSAALTWAKRAVSHDPRQLRAYAAVLVAARILPPEVVIRTVNRRGRGL